MSLDSEATSIDSDLPSLWSHEPHIHLQFRLGQKVGDIDAKATPGFRGSKSDAPALQDERNIRFAELQEMLYANNKAADDKIDDLKERLASMDGRRSGFGAGWGYVVGVVGILLGVAAMVVSLFGAKP